MTIKLWNDVSPASSYLSGVQFGVVEGPVRVCSAIFVVILQILAFGVLIRGSSWFAFDAATLTSSFDLFHSMVRHLQHTVLMVKDYKSAFFGGLF